MTCIAGNLLLLGARAEKGTDISTRSGGGRRGGFPTRPSEPDGALEGETQRGRPLEEECLQHRRDSRRPGQAGSAAAERARLMRELAGLQEAVALTKRLLAEEDSAPAAKEAGGAKATRPWPSGQDAREPAARGAVRHPGPARVLRISA
jgi:hypothetical protein